MGFGYDDEGSWRLRALLPLASAREELFRCQATSDEAANERDVIWADALVGMAERRCAKRRRRRCRPEAVARPPVGVAMGVGVRQVARGRPAIGRARVRACRSVEP